MDMRVTLIQNGNGAVWKSLTSFWINSIDYMEFRKLFPEAKFVGIDSNFEQWNFDGFNIYVHLV